MATFHLFESMPRMVKVAPGVPALLDRLMNSIFIFEGGELFDTSNGPPSMEYLLSLPTYLDQSTHYYAMLKRELTLRPILLQKLKKLNEERQVRGGEERSDDINVQRPTSNNSMDTPSIAPF